MLYSTAAGTIKPWPAFASVYSPCIVAQDFKSLDFCLLSFSHVFLVCTSSSKCLQAAAVAVFSFMVEPLNRPKGRELLYQVTVNKLTTNEIVTMVIGVILADD